jgi:hypothetical protein
MMRLRYGKVKIGELIPESGHKYCIKISKLANMDKHVKSTRKSIKTVSKKSKLEEIRPFIERPSDHRDADNLNNIAHLGAADLFSQFTANIINQNTVFTR